MKPSIKSLLNAQKALKSGGIGVLPTDTLYGLVGSALSRSSVERIYRIRKRNPGKPMIVLVSEHAEIKNLGISIGPEISKVLRKSWPGKVSVVIPCRSKKMEYLHRGERSLAFRVPKLKWLREFLRETGPLVAPSANFQGQPPALTIKEAKKYFGDLVDFYVDIGRRAGKPSKLLKVAGRSILILRK